MKRIPINSKWISIITICLVSIIIFLLVYSNLFVSNYIRQEQMAEKNRAEYENMAYSMEEAVTFTTEQVRKFTITEDMSCVELYWNEVNEDRHVERVIERLDKEELTSKEKHLLSLARDYTKLLREPDIRAMKLMSQALDCEEVMPKAVQEYKLNIVDEALSKEDKKRVARETLFTVHYIADQYTISTAINDFQKQINIRLTEELSIAREQTKDATVLQISFFFMIVILLFILLYIFYAYYMKPIKCYISDIKSSEEDIRLIQPLGSYEMQILAEAFNDMYKNMCTANHAKSNFVATMSHEIRTPLNTIIGYLHMLKGVTLGEKEKKYMESIEIASKNLLNMVNNILDFSKLEEDRMTFDIAPFSVRGCLEEIRKIFSNELTVKRLSYKLTISEDVPDNMLGDSSRLMQILINIVGNSIKFTSKGGVEIKVHANPRIDGKIMITFKIIDTGKGIPKDKLGSIFERYNQADTNISRKYGGSGLGLAICKKIVEQCKGKLEVESTEGIGTTFIVKLPLETSDNMAKEAREMTDILGFNKHKLLLVDDNLINLDMGAEMLEAMGFEVEKASSGEEAIEKVGLDKYDSILMDVRMSPMDGIKATRYIKALPYSRDIPVIALTGDVTEETIKRCKEVNMSGFVSKPLNINALILEMARCFGKNKDSIDWKNYKNEIDIKINSEEENIGECEYIAESKQAKNKETFGEDNKDKINNQEHSRVKDINNNIEEKLLKQVQESKSNNENYDKIAEANLSNSSRYNINLEDTKSMLLKFTQLAQSADLEAVDMFEDNHDIFKEILKGETFDEINSLINVYEIEAVGQIMKGVLENEI